MVVCFPISFLPLLFCWVAMTRVFDRVYGEIELPPLIARIASTQEFFRLDSIRQLGGCTFVYPSASHTRREHSIGVSYLAGLFAQHLQTLYGNVSTDDVLCLQVAGLIHDLGHGPFSHLFEEYMIEHDPSWDHEQMTLKMFQHLIEMHPEIDFPSYFATPLQQNLDFIRLMILGLDRDQVVPPSCGRDDKKRFLLDIVHNRFNGIDVDKIDYLARDALGVYGTQGEVPYKRIIASARLHEDHTIMFDERAAFTIVGLYELRARLHRQVYQHKAVLLVEELLKQVLRRTDLHTKATSPKDYVKLTDGSVLQHATSEDLFRRMTRLSGSMDLSTSPRCGSCKAPTDVRDRFCTRCGTSTATRVVSNTNVTAKKLTDILQFSVPECKVIVVVSDIKFGSPTTVWEHGRSFVEYCPLTNITFFDPTRIGQEDGGIVKVSKEDMQIPTVRHIRTAYCYVDGSVAQATEAWKKMCETRFGD